MFLLYTFYIKKVDLRMKMESLKQVKKEDLGHVK